MRKTMRNIEKVVGKKERAAWRAIDYCKQNYGKESVQYQKSIVRMGCFVVCKDDV